MMNAAMAIAAAQTVGLPLPRIATALADFPGIVRRQETLIETRDLLLVRDKATHPVALSGLIEAYRSAYPQRRVKLVLQPRATGGRLWIYQSDLPAALARVDQVFLVPAYEHQPANNRWSFSTPSTASASRNVSRFPRA